MEFLSDWTWWGLLIVSLAVAATPAFFQKIRFSVLAGIALFCLVMVGGMYIRNGTGAALAGAALILTGSFLALTASLIISGIGEMLKKRYR